MVRLIGPRAMENADAPAGSVQVGKKGQPPDVAVGHDLSPGRLALAKPLSSLMNCVAPRQPQAAHALDAGVVRFEEGKELRCDTMPGIPLPVAAQHRRDTAQRVEMSKSMNDLYGTHTLDLITSRPPHVESNRQERTWLGRLGSRWAWPNAPAPFFIPQGEPRIVAASTVWRAGPRSCQRAINSRAAADGGIVFRHQGRIPRGQTGAHVCGSAGPSPISRGTTARSPFGLTVDNLVV